MMLPGMSAPTSSKPRSLLWSVAAAFAVTIAALGLITATSQSARADIHRVPHYAHGCPAYAVCFYPGAGWNNEHPSFYYVFQSGQNRHYWSNLHAVYGTHRVFNNGYEDQSCYGSERELLALNTGYNGGGSHRFLHPGHYLDAAMTPINSITLWHTYWHEGTCF